MAVLKMFMLSLFFSLVVSNVSGGDDASSTVDHVVRSDGHDSFIELEQLKSKIHSLG